MKWYHSIDKPDANSYGKIKTWAEAVLVGIMALYQMDYLAGSSPLIAAMVLCIVLATASTYKHLEPWLRAKNLVPHPAST